MRSTGRARLGDPVVPPGALTAPAFTAMVVGEIEPQRTIPYVVPPRLYAVAAGTAVYRFDPELKPDRRIELILPPTG